MGLGDGVWIIYMFLTDLIFNRQGAVCRDAVAGNVRRCCAKSTHGVCNHLFPFQPSSLALMGVVPGSCLWAGEFCSAELSHPKQETREKSPVQRLRWTWHRMSGPKGVASKQDRAQSLVPCPYTQENIPDFFNFEEFFLKKQFL